MFYNLNIREEEREEKAVLLFNYCNYVLLHFYIDKNYHQEFIIAQQKCK